MALAPLLRELRKRIEDVRQPFEMERVYSGEARAEAREVYRELVPRGGQSA